LDFGCFFFLHFAYSSIKDEQFLIPQGLPVGEFPGFAFCVLQEVPLIAFELAPVVPLAI
jgi:hypothetical protein